MQTVGTMQPPQPLPREGRVVIGGLWGKYGTARATVPPVVTYRGKPYVMAYLDDAAGLKDTQPVYWSWPGRWRSDAFVTSLGRVRRAVKSHVLAAEGESDG